MNRQLIKCQPVKQLLVIVTLVFFTVIIFKGVRSTQSVRWWLCGYCCPIGRSVNICLKIFQLVHRIRTSKSSNNHAASGQKGLIVYPEFKPQPTIFWDFYSLWGNSPIGNSM